MENFCKLNIPSNISQALNSLGITEPTHIQRDSIPHSLAGHDILASAQTGTGKTIAYLIPVLVNLINEKDTKSLILAPTRELALQIMQEAQNILRHLKQKLNYTLLIGGEKFFKQLDQLKRKPRLIIGTPGRINDHLNRSNLNLNNISILVLDETDRMLDMGFSEQLDEIKSHITNKHQTLMFSATMPSNIQKLAARHLDNPIRVEVGEVNAPAKTVKQSFIRVKEGTKFSLLLKELSTMDGSVIIFVKTKRSADELANMLRQESHLANAIHGDLSQMKRSKVMAQFRVSKYKILVATDVAARGLDVPHVAYVVNFDLPAAEDYIHRIGRTGRAGAQGNAISFISKSREDEIKLRDIQRLIDPNSKERDFKMNQAYKKPKNRRSPSGAKFGRKSLRSNY